MRAISPPAVSGGERLGRVSPAWKPFSGSFATFATELPFGPPSTVSDVQETAGGPPVRVISPRIGANFRPPVPRRRSAPAVGACCAAKVDERGTAAAYSDPER